METSAFLFRGRSSDIELDALFWKKNWTGSDDDEFRKKISSAMQASPGWVMHGNYNRTKDLTWGACDTLIWLDYAKWVVIYRVTMRSVVRLFTREKLWAGNKETFSQTFLSKGSIIVWSWQTYQRRRQQYKEFMKDPKYGHIQVLVFKKPKEAEIFLKSIET